METVEQVCRNILSQAIKDGLVVPAVDNWDSPDPQSRSSGEMSGVSGIVSSFVSCITWKMGLEIDRDRELLLRESDNRTPHQARVEKLMVGAGQEVRTEPQIPPVEERELRSRLIFEECLKAVNGLGFTVCSGGVDISFETTSFYADREPNLIEIADGCADVQVVVTGTLSACGIKDGPLLKEVDESNLRKLGPGGYKDEHGKWRKPKDWVPPDIEGVLRRQGWRTGLERLNGGW